MTDPIWRKVHELTEGYPAEFNAGAVHALVLAAWRMGFNVVRDPAAPTLYLDAIQQQNEAMRNAVNELHVGLGANSLGNAPQLGEKP